MWYDRDILGLWVAASGMVYKDYNPDLHLITLDDYSKIYKDRIVEKWYSVDWGFEHYGVIQCWGVDYDGAYYLLDEVAEQHKDINYWIDIAKQLQIKYGRNVFYCDSARPDNIDMFNKSGINAMNAEKAVIEGISFVASLFKKNQIKICNHCENVRTTIYNYRWNDKTLKEEPIKEDDDGLDCMRYGIYSHFINGTNKLNWA
jgi:phage terminase large subunit